MSNPRDLAKGLSDFFRRDLIAIPLIKMYPHSTINQKCGLRSATLEMDTSAFPNIEYIAGTRLGVYPANNAAQVKSIMRHLKDDLSNFVAQQPPPPTTSAQPSTPTNTSTTTTTTTSTTTTKTQPDLAADPLDKWTQQFGKDSLRMALTYLYDIQMPPTRDLLRFICDNCTSREQKSKLQSIIKTEESWEKWICSSLRTLKLTFDEFATSCQPVSARVLLNELSFQQPRLYSISSIKSSKRFRAEIIVFEHKFSLQHITSNLLLSKERDRESQQVKNAVVNLGLNQPLAAMKRAAAAAQKTPGTHLSPTAAGSKQQVNQQRASPAPEASTSASLGTMMMGGARNSRSVRSLRSVADLSSSPISTHQVQQVPTFSGPLMSQYASSSTLGSVGSSASRISQRGSTASLRSTAAATTGNIVDNNADINSSPTPVLYEGLCSNHLLNLQAGDHIVCEFVENPRFTLKGNRERPIIMIGQDIGVVAFRPFWQQRSLEYDRAQVFYTLFKDLMPKKFGEMQLVCLTGSKCKIEDLFRNELKNILTHKIVSSLSYINKRHLVSLLSSAASISSVSSTQTQTPKVKIEDKELMELGNRIAKLLIEQNGCLYTSCDAQMTQAIEILTVESIARNYQQSQGLTRNKIMALLPKWKGKKSNELNKLQGPNNQYVFTLENPFERAQIVQEIYENSV